MTKDYVLMALAKKWTCKYTKREVEKWQKRIDDIQDERSKRYRHWKSMQEPEW